MRRFRHNQLMTLLFGCATWTAWVSPAAGQQEPDPEQPSQPVEVQAPEDEVNSEESTYDEVDSEEPDREVAEQEKDGTDEEAVSDEEAATEEEAAADEEAATEEEAAEQVEADPSIDSQSPPATAAEPAPIAPPGDEFFADEEELEFEAVAEVEAPPREPTKRVMDQEQLTRIPGTRGDALRSIEIMPGVARTEFAGNDGPPLLRGGSSWESAVLLDGAPVPLIYHFGGLTSFFNSHLLESVELTPGNYSARYGRYAGGIVEAKVRDPKSDRFHALIELSAIDSFAVLEGPLSEKTSIALAARRSNIDFFFKSFVPDNSYQVLAAPIYWDYQAILAHRFDDRHKLRALVFGSRDQLELYFGDSAPEDPALRGTIDGRLEFHRLQFELQSKLSDRVEQNLMVSVGPAFGDQTIGELSSKFRFWDIHARSEWSIFASDAVRIDTGLDLAMFAGTGEYVGPAPAQGEGNPEFGSLASEQYIVIEEKGLAPTRPGAFVEASLRPVEPWLIVPGVRADYVVDGDDWTVDPRFSTRLDVVDDTTLKGGVGLYSQPPEYFQVMEDLGNPDIKPFRTLQTSIGVEQRFGEFVKVDLDGFYKRWENRIVGTEGGAPPRFVNDGTGRAYGFEGLLDVRLTRRSQGFLSYTLSRSQRRDRDEPWRLFDYDQTHNLSLAANYDLGAGWLVGARFRYVTGNPTSEIESAVYDASTDTYHPLVREVNGARLTAFHQLDVRVEKKFDIGVVDLTTFLEVLNVYNAKNREGESYSFDYSESEGVTGMPIFPNLGIRGEL